MTAPYGTKTIYEAISRVCADVAGVKVVLGVNVGTAVSPIVLPLVDHLAELGLPAIMIWPGPWEIIAGQWRRDTHTVNGAIFTAREDPGENTATLLDLFDALGVAFAARSKAYVAESALQSVLLTRGQGLSSARWPDSDEGATYLTWPFELEVKVDVTQAYQAQ